MSTGVTKDWRRAFGIHDWKPPSYFASKAEIDEAGSAAPQAHALRRAFDRLSVSGILCLHNNPVVYFKEVTNIRPDQVAALHKQFWNQGLAPILVLIDDRDVHVYSGLARPVADAPILDADDRLVHRLNRVTDAAEIRQFVLSIESGDFFRAHAKSFDPKQRVDRDLLRNLQATRTALAAATTRKLTAAVLDALLCRIVFVCYLFDRNVIGESYLASIGIRKARHLRHILQHNKRQAKTHLYSLFKRLGEDFNGDLFSEDLDAEARQIANKHLDILKRFLNGTDVVSGQGAFWAYDFEMIPIETISAIYEHFLKAEDPEGKKKTGAFYTPRFLAEITLDIALEDIDTLLDKRFLDPACGSGIFLVGLFNRLAEEWKRQNPSARYDRRASSLIAILRDNIAGADVNPTACKIAAFSLYLALLDQLSPPDIQELQRKGKMLPRLVRVADDATTNATTLYCGDFFAEDAQLPTGTDVIVGNPPWASLTGPVTKAETWCASRSLPVPNRQLATAFVWKGAQHQQPGGRVCFVLPHGVLFNHQRKAIDFQRAWLERHAVDVVLNLADMRFNLFEAAVGPALIVRYRKDPPRIRDHRIKYLVPKTSWAISQAELVSVVPEDRTEVRLVDILPDLRKHHASPEWKTRFWGTPRDRKLLERLGDLPRLSAVVGQQRQREQRRWQIAEGFQPVGASDDRNAARTLSLPSKWFIEARSVGSELVLSQSDCERLASTQYQVRSRSNTNTDVFKGPHVLVTKGLNVSFADFAVGFRHAVRGIHGPREDRDLLVFLATYLRSPIARYYLFHTSSRWGIERADVEVAELLKVPFPLPEQHNSPKEARKLIAAIVKKVDTFIKAGRPVLSDREDAIRRLQAQCNEHLYEYFDIIDVERALIEDTEQVVIESILPKRASATLPTLKEATTDYRERYVDTLCETLNDWAREGPYRIHGRSHASSSGGVAAVILDRTRNGLPPAEVESDGAALMTVLDRLQRTFAKEFGSIELLRGVKVFDKETLYLFKPLAQRFWTRTAALNDADDIAATVLMRSRKERA
jgi:type I restriction-modification system DNA methylase subunit